jgi:WD40 repeat protein
VRVEKPSTVVSTSSAVKAAIVLTSVLGFSLVASQWRRAEDKAAEAIQAGQLAQEREEQEKEARLQVQRLVAHNALSEGVHLCENGETACGLSLLSGGNDHAAQLWDTATGQPQGTPLPHNYDVILAAFSPDGRSLFTACESMDGFDAAVWDPNAGRKRFDMHPAHRVFGAAFCDKGRALLVGDSEGNLLLYEASSGQSIGPPLKQDGPAYGPLEFSRDERTLLTGTSGGAILWDWSTRRQLKKLTVRPSDPAATPPGAPTSAYFYPDESGLLLVQNGFAQVWERDGSVQKPPPLFHAEGGIGELAFAPDSRSVLIRDSESRARLWDVSTGKQIGPAPGHKGIAHLAFSPNGRCLAVAGERGRIALWETPQPMQGTSERLRLWVETLVGMELDGQQMIHSLDADEVRRRRARLDELGGMPNVD